MNKVAKVVSASVYSLVVTIVLLLLCGLLLGRDITPSPEAMIPWTLSEESSIWLAMGSAPMYVASWAFYLINFTAKPPKWAIALIFLPSAVCVADALFWILYIFLMVIGQ